jgi:hypothetical protein
VKIDVPTSVLAVVVSGVIALAFSGRSETTAQVPSQPPGRVETVFFDKMWHGSSKDTFVDGAMRTTTTSYKDGRALTLRCFRPKSESPLALYDIRYQIDAPMLKDIAEQMIKKKAQVTLVVSIDDVPLEPLKAQIIAHDSGLSFLAQITKEAMDKIGDAKQRVMVVPRQGSTTLDSTTEFGTTDLAKHVAPVKAACKTFAAQPIWGPIYVADQAAKR